MRARSLAWSGSRQARPGWGSFVKTRRCPRWKGTDCQSSCAFCFVAPFSAVLGNGGAVKSRDDDRSLGGFLTSTFGNSEKSGWQRQRRLPCRELPRRGPGATPGPGPHLSGRAPLESRGVAPGAEVREKTLEPCLLLRVVTIKELASAPTSRAGKEVAKSKLPGVRTQVC